MKIFYYQGKKKRARTKKKEQEHGNIEQKDRNRRKSGDGAVVLTQVMGDKSRGSEEFYI